MSKSATVTARVTIGWSDTFVIEATLETLSAIRSGRCVSTGYLDNATVYYLNDRGITIEIIDAMPPMTASQYEAAREALRAAEVDDE